MMTQSTSDCRRTSSLPISRSAAFMPATQRPDLGTHAAHDRRRFYSIPGGVPSPQWLGAQWPKRTLVDVHAGDALAGLANQTLSRSNTLIDFAPHLGCACAGAVGGTDAQDARKAVVALEPPRAQSEIVNADVRVEVSLAIAGERPHAEVSWNDFLAALPAALAMHPERQASVDSARARPRVARCRRRPRCRARTWPRVAARDASAARQVRTGSTQPLAHVKRAQDASAADAFRARTEHGAQRCAHHAARRDHGCAPERMGRASRVARRNDRTARRRAAALRARHRGSVAARGIDAHEQRARRGAHERAHRARHLRSVQRRRLRRAPRRCSRSPPRPHLPLAIPRARAHAPRASDTHARRRIVAHRRHGASTRGWRHRRARTPRPHRSSHQCRRSTQTSRSARRPRLGARVAVAEHVRSRPAPGISEGRASRSPVLAPQAPAPVTTTLPSPTQTQATVAACRPACARSPLPSRRCAGCPRRRHRGHRPRPRTATRSSSRSCARFMPKSTRASDTWTRSRRRSTRSTELQSPTSPLRRRRMAIVPLSPGYPYIQRTLTFGGSNHAGHSGDGSGRGTSRERDDWRCAGIRRRGSGASGASLQVGRARRQAACECSRGSRLQPRRLRTSR